MRIWAHRIGLAGKADVRAAYMGGWGGGGEDEGMENVWAGGARVGQGKEEWAWLQSAHHHHPITQHSKAHVSTCARDPSQHW